MISMEKPDVVASKRYSAKQTSALLGIASSTLLVWTKKGYIKCQYHKIGMRRFYTGIDILKCWNMIA